jgi:glutamate mutase epsilon subunit
VNPGLFQASPPRVFVFRCNKLPQMQDPEFDNAILVQLGRITIAFSQLQITLLSYTDSLLSRNDRDAANIATAGIPANRLLEMFGSLLRLRLAEIYPSTPAVEMISDRIKKETVKIGNAMEDRNRVVHSQWIMNIQIQVGKNWTVRHITDTAIGVQNRKGFPRPKKYKAEDLKAIADSIASVTKQLVGFMQEVVETTGLKISPDPPSRRG